MLALLGPSRRRALLLRGVPSPPASLALKALWPSGERAPLLSEVLLGDDLKAGGFGFKKRGAPVGWTAAGVVGVARPFRKGSWPEEGPGPEDGAGEGAPLRKGNCPEEGPGPDDGVKTRTGAPLPP